MKKTLLALSLLVVLVFTSSCGMLFGEEPKTFTKSGMSITLTDAFAEKEVRSYTVTYESLDVAVFALKEEFTLAAGLEDYTLDEYADMVAYANEMDVEITKKDGLTYFVFDYSANGKDYNYLSCVYKGTDAFWLIQFSCIADNYDEYKDKFIEWAQSVEVE